jgi:hypothetical protein
MDRRHSAATRIARLAGAEGMLGFDAQALRNLLWIYGRVPDPQ